MPPEISIQPALKALAPNLVLGCVSARVSVEKHNQTLWQEIDQHLTHLRAIIKPEQINTVPQIAAMRSAYKALGKDPARYRGSAEALLRRVLAGKGLPQINAVVDVINLVSVESRLSIGLYDLAHVSGDIVFRAGRAGETYKGIGKYDLNLEGLPVFCDAVGPHGSPTSDSERTMVTTETKRVLAVIISFGGEAGLDRWAQQTSELFAQFAFANGCEIRKVS